MKIILRKYIGMLMNKLNNFPMYSFLIGYGIFLSPSFFYAFDINLFSSFDNEGGLLLLVLLSSVFSFFIFAPVLFLLSVIGLFYKKIIQFFITFIFLSVSFYILSLIWVWSFFNVEELVEKILPERIIRSWRSLFFSFLFFLLIVLALNLELSYSYPFFYIQYYIFFFFKNRLNF